MIGGGRIKNKLMGIFWCLDVWYSHYEEWRPNDTVLAL